MCSRELVSLLLCLFLGGCSADWYRERADTQTYDVIADKQKKELAVTRPFSIEPPRSSAHPMTLPARSSRTATVSLRRYGISSFCGHFSRHFPQDMHSAALPGNLA